MSGRPDNTGNAVPARTVDVGIDGVTLAPTGLIVSRDISFDEYESVGYVLGRLHDASKWAIGDLIAIGEGLFGEEAYQALTVNGRSPATLAEYARVARQVPSLRRRAGLTFTHHQLVASMEPPEQSRWLDAAEERGWNSTELRGQLKEPALVTKARTIRPGVEYLELVERIARNVLEARRRLGDGSSKVPDDVLDRLANALGVPGEDEPLPLFELPSNRRGYRSEPT